MERKELEATLESLRLLADGFMGNEFAFQVFARAQHALGLLLNEGAPTMLSRLEEYALEGFRDDAETLVSHAPDRAPVSAFAEVMDHAIGGEDFETLSASIAILSRLLRSGAVELNEEDRIAISKAFRLDSGIDQDSGQEESDRPPSKAFRLDH